MYLIVFSNVVAADTLLGNGFCGTVDIAPHYSIKSCSQFILTVPLCAEYHHHHHHIPPPSPRSQAVGLLCSPPF